MNRSFKGFLLVLVVGSLAILGVYAARRFHFERRLKDASDSGTVKETVTIGMDNWVGYVPLCGKEMRKRLHGAGVLLQCVDDNANTAERMKSLQSGKLDLAVATVDSFLLNAAPVKFPGAIVMLIDESNGGDAIVARKSKIASLEDLRKSSGFKVAFTPGSPSEHLLKSVATHFDVPVLKDRRGAWRVETNGSPEALRALKEGRVDVAVLWEPDVSKATAKGDVIKLLGTENTEKLIVDVLIASREYLQKHGETVKLVLANYFRTLRAYRNEPALLQEEIQAAAKVSSANVLPMLKGVKWLGLAANAQDWFGISQPGSGRSSHEWLVDTIEATAQILVDNGDFERTPVPQGDPYRLQYRLFVESLYLNGIPGAVGEDSPDGGTKAFRPLAAEQWAQLREVGTLRVRPIAFSSGTDDLGGEGREELDKAAENLSHYPNFRILVRGHTGLRGDPTANKQLSLERAEAVRRYLAEGHRIPEARMQAVGLGAEKPLPQLPDESERSYNYRLPRVELVLVSEDL